MLYNDFFVETYFSYYSSELLYLGNTIVKLPSFEPFSKCKLPPHPNKELTKATTVVLDGKVITCGGESVDEKIWFEGFDHNSPEGIFKTHSLFTTRLRIIFNRNYVLKILDFYYFVIPKF